MDALALLRLQIEWGADEALDDAPVDRLRPASPQAHPLPVREGAGGRGRGNERVDPSPLAPSTRGGGSIAPPRSTAAPSGTAAERALAAAGQAQTLDALRAAIAAFDSCALRDTAANLVFAAGAANAALLLIGDPPGEAEDRSGVPFAGPQGDLLDRMLASIGLSRESLLLTPLIPWRPPGGRPPSAAEIAVCLPFLHRLIAIAAPDRLLLAGPLAAKTLLGTVRRRATPAWSEAAIPGIASPVPAVALPSPALVARTPSARREAWAALRLLRRTIDA